MSVAHFCPQDFTLIDTKIGKDSGVVNVSPVPEIQKTCEPVATRYFQRDRSQNIAKTVLEFDAP